MQQSRLQLGMVRIISLMAVVGGMGASLAVAAFAGHHAGKGGCMPRIGWWIPRSHRGVAYVGGLLIITGWVGLVATPGAAQPFAYVTNWYSGTIAVIDTATNTVVATTPVGEGVWDVAVSPDGAFIYVGSYVGDGPSTLAVLTTTCNTMVAMVPLEDSVDGLAITPDSAFAYAALSFSDAVAVIDTTSRTVVATIPVAGDAREVAVTPDGMHVYVVAFDSGAVVVLDVVSNTVVARIGAGTEPRHIAITPDGAYAYVTTLHPRGGTWYVTVIDTARNTVIATIPVAGGAQDVAISPVTTVPFHAFSAQVEFTPGPDVQIKAFEAKATFTLGPASTGIYPLTEPVTLQVGTFAATIPAGAFRQHHKGPFTFEGTLNGASLEAKLIPLDGNTFEFTAEGRGVHLPAATSPMGLMIGADSGCTSGTAQLVGSLPSPAVK